MGRKSIRGRCLGSVRCLWNSVPFPSVGPPCSIIVPVCLGADLCRTKVEISPWPKMTELHFCQSVLPLIGEFPYRRWIQRSVVGYMGNWAILMFDPLEQICGVQKFRFHLDQRWMNHIYVEWNPWNKRRCKIKNSKGINMKINSL